MMRYPVLQTVFFFCTALSLQAAEVGLISDHWVASDALGRELPTHSVVGDRRADKAVGVFYFVWNGNHAQAVYDISKILKQAPSKRQWGPEHATHFACEPEVGYFHSSDPWVLRRDMQMLANADVDFIYLDVTNNLLYRDTVDALLSVIHEMRGQGIPAPKVAFLTNAGSGRCMNVLHDRYYNNPAFADLWFDWEGRPLIFGKMDDPVLRNDVAEAFTIKRSWAWTAARTTPNEWQWLDTWPQDYGWSASPGVADQLPVSTASHASNSTGKSFHQGRQPSVGPDYMTADTHRGLFFEEQWTRAHEVDPKVLMITQWNEWIAMRFIKQELPKIYAGRPPLQDGSWFVDVLTPEFSRDIAPMRGGYTDNYYYQMLAHIRRYKGLAAPPARAAERPIRIDGRFDDWVEVRENHHDPIGDTQHRHFRGTDPATIYTNSFGRNDLLATAVVESGQELAFMVRTAADLTPHTDPRWMVLLIDRDQNKDSGWQGYDLALNWRALSPSESRSATWVDGAWVESGTIAIGYQGKQLELSVPNQLFPRTPGAGLDFKWVDNVSLNAVDSLFLEGDVAPDRRFNFRY